jgi:hypothetical protein
MGCHLDLRHHVGRNLDVLQHDLQVAGFHLRQPSQVGEAGLQWILKRDGVKVRILFKPTAGDVIDEQEGYDLQVETPTGITRGGRRRCSEVRDLIRLILNASFNVRPEALVVATDATRRRKRRR